MHPLVEAMANMKEKEALQIVDDLLAKGEDPNKILDLSSEAMQVADHKPQVLALSEAAGLRKDLKIIIGGGQMDDTVRKYTGADAYGDDAMAAVAFAKATVGVA
jgi:methanogenic corrinoid protein MtbC1